MAAEEKDEDLSSSSHSPPSSSSLVHAKDSLKVFLSVSFLSYLFCGNFFSFFSSYVLSDAQRIRDTLQYSPKEMDEDKWAYEFNELFVKVCD